ncbi:MAG TPA: N-formylglutamate amidohydrolase, partial [Rhodanobacteraceae bacterium]
NGASCSPALQARLAQVLDRLASPSVSEYSRIVNGRFKGGHITRHYGQPSGNIEAVQLELAQCTYMDEDSFEYLPERAFNVQRVIRALLEECLAD